MALRSSLGQNTSWLLVEEQTTQIRMALVLSHLLNTIKATCYGHDPGLLCNLWWKHRPRYGPQQQPGLDVHCPG